MPYDRSVHSDKDAELELARSLLTGSEDAFDEFVNAYRTKLFQYSFLMCGQREDAEEVAQETLLRVFQSVDQLRDPERLKSWVFRIAKNACLMKRRKSVYAPAVELSLDQLHPRHGESEGAPFELADWSKLPDELASDEEARSALTAAIENLPDIYRSVILLRDVEEMTTEEAGEILDISVDTVKQRLHRGRLALRRQLDFYLRNAGRDKDERTTV